MSVRANSYLYQGKKAGLNITFNLIIELVLGLLITAFFISYTNNIENNTLFERTFIAKDLALVTNTIQAAPQDVIVSYEPKYKEGGEVALSKYSYDFADNFVKLQLEKYDKDQFQIVPEKLLVSYPIDYNNNLGRYHSLLEKPQRIVLAKVNNVFTVDDKGVVAIAPQIAVKLTDVSTTTGKVNLVKLDCGSEKPITPIQQILLDADSGYYKTIYGKLELSKGVSNLVQDQIEIDITWDFLKTIETSLKTLTTAKNYLVTKTRVEKIPKESFTTEARLKKITPAVDLLIILKNYYSESHSDNTIKIYYEVNNKDSKKLACFIHNALVDQAMLLNLQDFQQPLMTELAGETTKPLIEKIEKNSKLGLQIEIGNVAVPSNKLFTLNVPLAKAIKQGIDTYEDQRQST